MEMTVVKPVVAVEVGGRENKRRKRKQEGLQRGERNQRWLLVVVPASYGGAGICGGV